MGRSPCCDESGLKKGPWTPEEDDKLIQHIQKHGHGSWRALPKLAGLNRCGKSCRLRWTNYLRPDIKRGKFSQDEEQTILNLHSILGNKWSAIATHLPGRTDNEIKNFWNTHLKKKLIQMGFDPMTHRPRTDIFSSLPHLIALANLIANPCWEEQHEAVQMARLNQTLQYDIIQPTTYPNTTTTTTSTNTPVLDLTSFNLSNTLKEYNPILKTPTTFLQDSVPFSHLPDLLQADPCLSKATVHNKTSSDIFSPVSLSSPWFPISPSVAAAPPLTTEASITTNIVNSTGDACSASSYVGPQMWSDLLDDPFFHEIA